METKFIKKTLLILALSQFSYFCLNAQFSIIGEYRSRAEVRDGYRKLNTNGSTPSVFISQRTRISFEFKNERIAFKFTPQDVRIWGDEMLSSSTGVYGDQASLDVFEAFSEIYFKKSSVVTIGRQQLAYDSERILAKRNWNQNGLAYDAVVFKTKLKNFNLHIGSSWNSMTESLSDIHYLSDRIKTLNYLWLNKEFNNNSEISFLHTTSGITENDSSNTLNFKHTSGIYFHYVKDKYSFKGNGYYQFGKDIQNKAVNAFLTDIELSLKLNKLTTSVGLNYLSGNSLINGETNRLFDVLYGARHRYFGHMDYFRDFKNQTNEAGLGDLYISLNYDITKNISISNIGSYFQLANTNELTSENKNLGFENALVFNYKINRWASIKSEYIFFLPTESFKIIQDVPDSGFNQFFFLEITVKPTIFENNQINKINTE